MINIKSVKPLFTKILVTAEVYEEDTTANGLIVKEKGCVKDYQKVVAVGSMVRDIKVGDLVAINPQRYIKKKYDPNSIKNDFDKNPTVSVDIPTIEMNGIKYFMLESGLDIDYVIDDWEEVKDVPKKSAIITPRPIENAKSKIILN